jgi:RNA recognition motif-containing protein
MGEACKVHVGNLSYSVTEDALFAAFEKCGAVDQGLSKELDIC